MGEKKTSGSGSKFRCAARVGSGRLRRSRVRAGFGLQFKARADLYMQKNKVLQKKNKVLPKERKNSILQTEIKNCKN